jgi:hypothetical protein
MVYKYRSGHSCLGLTPQQVGEELERIRQLNGGIVEARHVVDVSRQDGTLLHEQFDWDNDIAGENWREDQARRIIRSIAVVQRDPATNREIHQYAFISVAAPFTEGAGYQAVTEAMANPDLRQRIIDRERAILDGWIARNRHIEELAVYVQAIQAAREAAHAPAAALPVPPGNRRRRNQPPPPQPQARP